ncbi:MAG: hypothetical protein PW788_04065 [Micavibrio sp.]|nr:hypothetical protein [Micavibrio sp.]
MQNSTLNKAGFLLGVTALAAMLGASPAFAQNDLSYQPFGAGSAMQAGTSRIISAHDRDILRDFLVQVRGRMCDTPNKNTLGYSEPCAVPSRVIHYYPAGTTLPQNKIYEVLPQYVESRLSPPPRNMAYVFTGDNVYLVDALTHRITDRVSMADAE